MAEIFQLATPEIVWGQLPQNGKIVAGILSHLDPQKLVPPDVLIHLARVRGLFDANDTQEGVEALDQQGVLVREVFVEKLFREQAAGCNSFSGVVDTRRYEEVLIMLDRYRRKPLQYPYWHTPHYGLVPEFGEYIRKIFS